MAVIVDDYIYSLDISDAVNASTPAAQYTAWCAALGVSATVPIMTMDGDDGVVAQDLGSVPTPDGIAKALFSCEGILSYWKQYDPLTPYPYVGPSVLDAQPSGTVTPRRGYVAWPGKIAFAFSHVPSGQDSEVVTSMFQRAGAVSLWKGRTRTLGTTTNQVDFAVRQEGTTTVIVMRPAGVNSYLSIYTGMDSPTRLAASVATLSNVNRIITVVVSPSALERPVLTSRRSSTDAVVVPPTLAEMQRTFTRRSGARAGPNPVDGLSSMLGVGRGRISGTVAEDKDEPTADVPLRRIVRLIREQDGMVVAQQWSNATTGAYQFDYVDELYRYTVISYDYEKNFRAVVADNLEPDLIALP